MNKYSHTLLVRLKIGLGFGETICCYLSKGTEVQLTVPHTGIYPRSAHVIVQKAHIQRFHCSI